MNKNIVFLTGTRAEFGKLKPLMKKIEESDNFECHIFVTGMHTLSKYGSTYHEVEKEGFENIYRYINQSETTTMDLILSNTIIGFSNYVNELKPDLIVIHGDRVEALAGAIVGSFRNILVSHIEGGEVSGTIDEVIRHSITKLSHVHFVSNKEAKRRVKQLGEDEQNIFVIGSPETDVMLSEDLPSIEEAKERYDIPFEDYSIFVYHPVTTKLESLEENIKEVVSAIISSDQNYIVIYPNNDEGSEIILDEYERFEDKENILMYPSIRFEYYLTFLKNCEFIIGNSSSGVREAEVYGTPSINIGERQENRRKSEGIIDVKNEKNEILGAIKKAKDMDIGTQTYFGDGNSAKEFYDVINSKEVWNISYQKNFVDIDNL